jgi:hypothetical protein
MTAPPKHAAALAWAVDQLGQTEHPPGSNRGPFVQFCQARTWLKGSGWPWCAAFAVTAIMEGGGLDYPDKTAGAWDLLTRGAKRGWAVGASQAIPGDLVVFNIGSGHVGVVEQIKGGRVISIDGNSGDAVARCNRPLTSVRGFVHWPENLAAHKKSRAPIAQIVGSESGRRKLVVAGKTVRLPSTKVT